MLLYSDVRERIHTGDLLFFRGRLLHSRLIQCWTKSVYSHVGVGIWLEAGPIRRLFVAEALEGRGVQLFPLSRYLSAGESVDWFAVIDESFDRDYAAGWALAQVGLKYASIWQMLRSFGLISKWIADHLGLPTKIDRDRWFCSCYAIRLLEAGGVAFSEAIDPSLTPPGGVAFLTCLRRMGTLSHPKDSL